MYSFRSRLVLLTTSAAVATSTFRKPLNVVSWNVAAINNNPFEYWIEHDDPKYGKLMKGVESFMSNPAEDLPIEQVFSQAKYDELESLLLKQPRMTPELLKEVREERWNKLKNKKIISGFLKDEEIGKKRLASMPDRMTNTITIRKEENSGETKTFYRPTPINCCSSVFSGFDDWWVQWKAFMFDLSLPPKGNNVVSILKPIPRTKYPELTDDDERVSLPLQIVSQAIFDAILVHMLEKTGKDSWQSLRKELCEALNLKKNSKIMDILSETYSDSDVLCLQEVGKSLIVALGETSIFKDDFWIIYPSSANALSRDQNSVILLRKTRFPEKPVDVSQELELANVPVEEGDLLVVRVLNENKEVVVVSSFHGDTDGLATIPVLRAVTAFASQSNAKLIFGLDANSYNSFKKGKQLDVREFNQDFVSLKLTSCFGNKINPENFTTYNARTFLQPQLNKAASREQFKEKGDVNPKDFILTFEKDGYFEDTRKDNTGEKQYIEGMAFPTLKFPSDHGILSTKLTLIERTKISEL